MQYLVIAPHAVIRKSSLQYKMFTVHLLWLIVIPHSFAFQFCRALQLFYQHHGSNLLFGPHQNIISRMYKYTKDIALILNCSLFCAIPILFDSNHKKCSSVSFYPHPVLCNWYIFKNGKPLKDNGLYLDISHQSANVAFRF